MKCGNDDAASPALLAAISIIKDNVSSFDCKEAFNTDERGLLYKTIPEITLALTSPLRWKKKRKRTTVLVRDIFDCSKKVLFMFVGNAFYLGAYKKKPEVDSMLDYHANKTTRTTEALFNA